VLPRWSIRYKISVGVVLLLVIVVALATTGFRGASAYRGLARSVSRRAGEIPRAYTLAQHISDLRITLSLTKRLPMIRSVTDEPPLERQFLQAEFQAKLLDVHASLRDYEDQLTSLDPADQTLGDYRREQEKLAEIKRSLQLVEEMNKDADWILDDIKVGVLSYELENMQQLSSELPAFLHQRMADFAKEVRLRYRVWMIFSSATGATAFVLLVLLLVLSWHWVFRPLRVLVRGSRRVAGGDFDHRIQLHTHDEMSALADMINAMTQRFQEIRDKLDRKVKERTQEVVRSERMASVGFLAAGVAHEINNPLASIALCAESIEDRLTELVATSDEDAEQDGETEVLRSYLTMIEDEAFRCKGITDSLLDFSRMGDLERHDSELRELIHGVIEMVRHLGKYREKTIVLVDGDHVVAPVNAQEIKQVMLNLITNALDSLEGGGTVTVALRQTEELAEIRVSDDGCGMTPEVMEHLFEPFFTRRRNGGGTGLGLSITYRIVTDHGGRIVPHSDGPGAGSQFIVTLPLSQDDQENRKRRQAA
jgi:two-component system NtrC family sensor kinase